MVVVSLLHVCERGESVKGRGEKERRIQEIGREEGGNGGGRGKCLIHFQMDTGQKRNIDVSSSIPSRMTSPSIPLILTIGTMSLWIC